MPWMHGTPASHPLVFPAGSLEGAFSESGLYHIVEFSNPPVLTINPYSWNNITNNLFIEAPSGVGFSYCDTAAGCDHTDTSTAADNLQALISFFAAYPELAGLSFWITGESYAGIYIPMLAYNVYKYNQGSPAQPINLKGTMVGNGCIGNAAGHCGTDPLNDYHDVMEWRGHALMEETLFDNIMGNCSFDGKNSLTCDLLLAAAALEKGDLDVYYLYNTCSDPALSLSNLRAPLPANSLLRKALEAKAAKQGSSKAVQKGKKVGTDPNCFGTGPTLEAYFNQASVKSALHVAPGIDWALCSNNGTFNYNGDMDDERKEIYPTIVTQAGYKVLVYNGEADLCVPYTDNEYWTRSMGYSVAKPWTAWEVQGEQGAYVGGYVIHYAPPGGGNFSFATVRGAGHMVPETRPEAALALLTAWTTGTL